MAEERTWRTGPPDDPGRYEAEGIRPGSTVFPATRRSDGRRIALKQLGPVSEHTAEAVRVAHEAARACSHPGLAVPVETFRGPGLYQTDPPPEDEHDLLYAVTEWVDGQTLWARQAIDLHQFAGPVAVALAESLSRLHDAGFAHGDVHPGNIVLTDDGAPVLIDIDSIRSVGSEQPLDSTGVLGFIPPETDRLRTDTASDGWQLAMVIVQLLLGHPLGRGDHQQELEDGLVAKLGRRRGAAVRDVLSTMLATDPARRPSDLRRWSGDLDEALSTDPRPRIRPIAVAAGVGAALAAAIIVATTGDHGDDPTENAATTPLVAVAPADATCQPPSGAAALPQPQQRLLGAMADDIALVLDGQCATGVSSFVNALVLQTEPNGDVVVVSEESAVRLTGRQWDSYREIGGRQRPENAADVGGYPIAVQQDDHARVFIELSGGGVMIALSPSDPPYWIPAQLRPTWIGAGGIDGEWGPPASHPFLYEGGLVQDFEFVEVHTGADAMFRAAADIDFEVIRPEDPAGPLEEVGPVAGRILRQRSGIAWFVDQSGTRHWIPDGETFACVGGDDALIERDLPASAIWTLPVGAVAVC